MIGITPLLPYYLTGYEHKSTEYPDIEHHERRFYLGVGAWISRQASGSNYAWALSRP
jgi:hypothetical protein